jgi:hypothetical protein
MPETQAQVYLGAGLLREQFETEAGQAANADFGAHVIQPMGSDLLIGLGNFPADLDGALVVRINASDASTVLIEHVLNEQGVGDMQLLGDGRVFIPGADPVDQPNEWTLGNLYERSALGTWTKHRTLPNVLHSFGLWHDGTNLFVATGAHTGDNATWKGRVLRSADDGATWAAQVDVNNYRMMDVLGHSGRLYAIGYDFTMQNGYTQDLHVSSNNGATWSKVAVVTPNRRPRMMAFGATLLVASATSIYQIDASHAISAHSIPFTLPELYNILATDGTNVYVIDEQGYVWRSSDLSNWTRYTYVTNALALCWWPGVGLLIADRGLSARVWVA